MNGRIAAVDIGSTYTKGALFEVEPGALRCLLRASCPTTREDLGRGFFRVLADLLDGEAGPETPPRDVPVRFSSSAKGGLRIAAVGLVPDLTLQVARLAAWSAGGRIVGDSAYRLTAGVLTGILETDPDIILLTGGTDGGNEKIVVSNARMIAESPFEGTVLYAGNAAVRDEVGEILRKKKYAAAENVMPQIGVISIEPAREQIRRVFLDTIVHGRGLDRLRDFCGADPRPTPLAVYDLVSKIGELRPDWRDFCVIDPGGATTDFYSNSEAFRGADGVLLKGLREPRVKRTVEGDLGLRISAESLVEGARDYLRDVCGEREVPFGALEEYAAKVKSRPEHTAAGGEELLFDGLLCEAAASLAALRHSGSIEASYFPAGKVYLQQGKDLRSCARLVGTGGFLSRFDCGEILRRAFRRAGRSTGEEKIPLVPENFRYYRDSRYLFPLLGSLAGEFPEEAVTCALENLEAEKI